MEEWSPCLDMAVRYSGTGVRFVRNLSHLAENLTNPVYFTSDKFSKNGNILTFILKTFEFIPFLANLTQFGANANIPRVAQHRDRNLCRLSSSVCLSISYISLCIHSLTASLISLYYYLDIRHCRVSHKNRELSRTNFQNELTDNYYSSLKKKS